MGVHSIYIFDRRGKTLFTKRYAKSQGGGSGSGGSVTTTIEDEEQLSEQRKLIFGMLFSVRELVNNIAPTAESSNKVIGGGKHSIYIKHKREYQSICDIFRVEDHDTKILFFSY